MILDTKAISALVDGDAGIEPRLRAIDVAAIPAIALGEFRFGVAQSRKRAAYEAWLRENLELFRILSVDQETAEVYAEVRLELKIAGTPIPVNDLWIAALTRQHHLPILSRDGHFDSVKGLRRIGW